MSESAIVVKTVSMYPAQWEAVDAVAAGMGLSRSHALRHIVEIYKHVTPGLPLKPASAPSKKDIFDPINFD